MLTAAHLLNWSVDIVQHNPLAQDAFVTTWLHVKNAVAVKIGIWTVVDTLLYHFDSCWYIAVSYWQLLIHRCTTLTAVDTSLHHFDSCRYIAAPFHCSNKTTWNRCSRVLPSERSLFLPRLNLTRCVRWLLREVNVLCVRWLLWEENVLQCKRFYLVTSYFISRAWGTFFIEQLSYKALWQQRCSKADRLHNLKPAAQNTHTQEETGCSCVGNEQAEPQALT